MPSHQMSAILPDFAGFTISRGGFHLRILEKLGKGAYGVVHVAEDVSPCPRPNGPHYYAVKCLLRPPRGSKMASLQQYEIANHRIVSEIPGVVTLHAVIEEDFYTFLVLDLCEGGDLFSAIMERDTYVNNNAAVKRSILQIIDALEACHAKGVYHRDLKPENILCSRDDGRVYISDFGLATRHKRSSRFGCGSSFYMSPECLGTHRKGEYYRTGPSDVWALGMILCNLVTGRNPWHIASPKEDDGFRRYLRKGPKWVMKNLPVSVGATAILCRIFDVNPATRITLQELRESILALDTFYPSESSSASTSAVSVPEMAESDATKNVSPSVSATGVYEIDMSDSEPRPRRAPGYTNDADMQNWELAPIPHDSGFQTDFMNMTPEAIAMAASATLAGTIDTFVNSDYASQSDDEIENNWAISGPPQLAISPEPSSSSSESGDESSEDSDGPVTPETHATAGGSSVPVLALDNSSSPPESENGIAFVTARVEALKVDDVEKKRRRNSVGRFMDELRRIAIRA